MGGRKKKFARLWCLKNKEHYVVPLATIPKMHREIGKIFNYHRVENKLLEIGETSLDGRTSSPTLNNKKETSPVKNNVMKVQLPPIITSPPLSNSSSTTEPPSSTSLVNLNNTSAEEDGVLNLKTVPIDKSSTQSNVMSSMQQTTSPILMEKNMTSKHTSSTFSPLSSTGTTHAQKTNELQSASTSQSTVLDQTPEIPEYQNNFLKQNSVIDFTSVPLALQNEFLTSNTSTFQKPLISPGLMCYFSALGSQFQQINDFNDANPPSFPNDYTDDQDTVVEQSLTMPNSETVNSSVVEDITGHTSPVMTYKRLKTMHLPSSTTANVQDILRSNPEQLAVDNDQTVRTDIASSKSTIATESETLALNDKLSDPSIFNSNSNDKSNEDQRSSIAPMTDPGVIQIVTELLKCLPDGEITLRDVMIQRSLYLIVQRLYEL
ncbi:hypothetical protein KQX54_012544 [Cotesia glomerata]|uniref:Uncharacterized protein n=1 Tax=Cotesia glomerata TaxID=32391 RepID=A0AAV7ID68_COTGL|nr:hypothetical protein KQX54_012544 [Cotesia glomerata]